MIIKRTLLLIFLLSGLGSLNPVNAEVRKTIYITDGGHEGGFHGGTGGAPVKCINLGSVGGRTSLKCTANKGYVFWVGRCNSPPYIRTGKLGKDKGTFCLRKVRENDY